MPTNTTEIELKIGLSDSDKASMQAAITALVKASLITVYSSSATYALGDFVYYDGKFYKCTTAISTAEAWTSGHWTEATLNDVINKVNQAANSVENKVDPDDICPELRAGYAFTADNLNATKGLTVNDDPMSFGIVGGAQKSAVGDGNASLNKLVCVDVVRNQHFNPTYSNVKCGVRADVVNGVVSISGTSDDTGNGPAFCWTSFNSIPAGNKYIVLKDFDLPAGDFIFDQYNQSSGTDIINKVLTNTAGSIILQLHVANSGISYNISNKHFYVIDITKRYGNNEVVNAIIGTGTPEEQFARLISFDPEILSDTDHDTGTMVPSKTAKLLSVGVNQLQGDFSVSGSNVQYVRKILQNPIQMLQTSYCLSAMTTAISAFIVFRDSSHVNLAEGYLTSTQQDGRQYGIIQRKRNGKIAEIDFYYDGVNATAGTFTYSDICINISDTNINGKYYPSKRNPVALPNYEGHGILKVVDGKVVADGTELYPDGNSKKRYDIVDLGTLVWNRLRDNVFASSGLLVKGYNVDMSTDRLLNLQCSKYPQSLATGSRGKDRADKTIWVYMNNVPEWTGITIKDSSYDDVATFKAAMSGVYLVYELAAEEDIITPVYQSTFPVEQGGTLEFLDEDDNPIAGLQGSEIFYQKNIKAFVEALGEATNWDPERIKRLGNLSFTPEYEIITLNPSFPGAYARAQVYNATFTIVISAALTGSANESITFQDSEVNLSNLQTKPAESIIDMDGKKVSEAPTTADCNIASFVGRSKSGTVLWSLLHSGVNKVKIHIEEAVPLDSEGNGKIDCRASLIL